MDKSKADLFLIELKKNGMIYNGIKVYAYIHPASHFFNKNEVVIRPLNRADDAGAGKGVILFLDLDKP